MGLGASFWYNGWMQVHTGAFFWLFWCM